jgi:O-acetyl-ADP-ribose deacetylase (regulator of RNase III)
MGYTTKVGNATFHDILLGSIFDSGADVLVCPVNCVPGVMGKGLALAFAKKWPNIKALHRDRIARGTLSIGTPDTVWAGDDGPRVMLFPTKRDWREPARINDIGWGLASAVAQWGTRNTARSIAFPALGCGLGGLARADVRPLIVEAMASLDITVMLYAPKEGET